MGVSGGKQRRPQSGPLTITSSATVLSRPKSSRSDSLQDGEPVSMYDKYKFEGQDYDYIPADYENQSLLKEDDLGFQPPKETEIHLRRRLMSQANRTSASDLMMKPCKLFAIVCLVIGFIQI